ncbi:MAG: hypothetical protein QM278_12240 [Pseudomonadota bacterium]|nr:hypothetical protein [Pseudomonadota bacterium]
MKNAVSDFLAPCRQETEGSVFEIFPTPDYAGAAGSCSFSKVSTNRTCRLRIKRGMIKAIAGSFAIGSVGGWFRLSLPLSQPWGIIGLAATTNPEIIS